MKGNLRWLLLCSALFGAIAALFIPIPGDIVEVDLPAIFLRGEAHPLRLQNKATPLRIGDEVYVLQLMTSRDVWSREDDFPRGINYNHLEYPAQSLGVGENSVPFRRRNPPNGALEGLAFKRGSAVVYIFKVNGTDTGMLEMARCIDEGIVGGRIVVEQVTLGGFLVEQYQRGAFSLWW